MLKNNKMKTKFLKIQSSEKKTVCFIIGLFVLNAFGLIPVGVIGAYTAEPMKITSSETLEDGTIKETTNLKYYTEGLSENIQSNVYEFFRYSLPLAMSGYFLVTPPDFTHDYIGVVVWILAFASIPLAIRYTAKFPRWHRIVYVYLIAVQISGMWALHHINFECISLIDYPIRPGPPCKVI